VETQITPRQQVPKGKDTQPETDSLKGTFAAVLLIGAFILLSWFGAFGLFLDRG
jgi:hypothetical protein